MTSISDLIERVREAEGSDRELDRAIERFEHGPDVIPFTPAYTASIDAAKSWADRMLPGCIWTIEADACWLRVLTADDVAKFQGHKPGMGGKWTPLAIILATLTALQQQAEQTGDVVASKPEGGRG